MAIFVPVLIGIAILLAGTTIVVKWDDIVIALRGIAVLGARGVGKTHLVKFLTTGEYYKQTVAPEKAPSHRFSLKDLDLKVEDLEDLDIKVKETLDLSGDTAAYAEWKEVVNKADVVFYLLRADRLIAGDRDVEKRVQADDLKHIRRSYPYMDVVSK